MFLAELVEHKELPGQEHVLLETARRQLDAHDDLTVGHHHGDGAELNLEVLGQLLTTGVARVLANDRRQ